MDNEIDKKKYYVEWPITSLLKPIDLVHQDDGHVFDWLENTIGKSSSEDPGWRLVNKSSCIEFDRAEDAAACRLIFGL